MIMIIDPENILEIICTKHNSIITIIVYIISFQLQFSEWTQKYGKDKIKLVVVTVQNTLVHHQYSLRSDFQSLT